MNESRDKTKIVHSWFLAMSLPCETEATHFTFVEKLQNFFHPKLYLKVLHSSTIYYSVLATNHQKNSM